MKQKIIKFTILAIILLIIVLLYILVGKDYLSFEAVAQHQGFLKAFVTDNFALALLIYILTYTTLIGSALPFAALMSISGGFLFGPVWGVFGASLGATMGDYVFAVVLRYFVSDSLIKRAGPKVLKFKEGFHLHAFNYILFLRLMPIIPFVTVNIAASLFRVPLWKYVTATYIGIMPACFVYVSIGVGLDDILTAVSEDKLSQALSPNLIFGLIGLGCLALLPILYGYYKKRKI